MNDSFSRLFYDLHIHSCLSPCGDNDMTPANIAGMAMLKGLDIVALTDHNSCKNCPAFLEACKTYGITAIPGMELTTIEEVHCVCLFPSLDKAMEFDAYVSEHLIQIPNRADIFGNQYIYNEKDQIVGEEKNLLIQATDISFDQVFSLVKNYEGVMIPAHVDKNSFSLLSNLGFISPDNQFTCAEIFSPEKKDSLISNNPYLKQCRILYNSDAHCLEQINEAIHFIRCDSRKKADILHCLEQKPFGPEE